MPLTEVHAAVEMHVLAMRTPNCSVFALNSYFADGMEKCLWHWRTPGWLETCGQLSKLSAWFQLHFAILQLSLLVNSCHYVMKTVLEPMQRREEIHDYLCEGRATCIVCSSTPARFTGCARTEESDICSSRFSPTQSDLRSAFRHVVGLTLREFLSKAEKAQGEILRSIVLKVRIYSSSPIPFFIFQTPIFTPSKKLFRCDGILFFAQEVGVKEFRVALWRMCAG